MSKEEPIIPVRIRDIAHHLKVSEVTVSLALRNHPRISEARRKQVQETAAAMGYQPNAMAAALAHRKWAMKPTAVQSCLAWINGWPDPQKLRSYKEFDLYWKGAYRQAEHSGYRLEEFICNQQMPAVRLEKILLTRNVPGILIPPHGGLKPWEGFNWNKFCVVRFGYTVPSPRAHIVTSDQLTDGLIALQNAWRLGYRRVGMMTTKMQRQNVRFVAGYLYGMLTQDAYPFVPPLLLDKGPDTGQNAHDQQKIQAWLKKHKPDAILEDDLNVPAALRKLGYRVPEDIGVATLSVLDGSSDAGIYQNPEDVGRAAVQLLISLIHHSERGIPSVCREVLIEGKWVDGKSLPPRS